MKRILLTGILLSVGAAASARRSDTILESDPNGIYVTIISVSVVVVALIVLCLLITLFALIMVRNAQKKAAQTKVKSTANGESTILMGRDSVENGEIIAAIALAIKVHFREMHDHESDVITINKVARVYSPWSSKLHGLTPMPKRIR